MASPITFVVDENEELKRLLSNLDREIPFTIVSKKMSLPQKQLPYEEMMVEKAREAARHVKGPVLIEKWFLSFKTADVVPNRNESVIDELRRDPTRFLPRLINKDVNIIFIFAFSKGEYAEPIIFRAIQEGTMVQKPSSKCDDWSSQFQPFGFEHTFAEMGKAERLVAWPYYRALKDLQLYLTNEYRNEEFID